MSEGPAELTTDAYYWEIQRLDGVGLATTTHDRVNHRDAIRFEPDPSFVPRKVVLTDTMVGSTLELQGALTSNGLSEHDLVAGRWSSAHFRLGVGDWGDQSDPKAELLCGGELGGVQIGEDGFEAEVIVTPARLSDQACPQTSPECRAQLGDPSCRVNLRDRRVRMEIISCSGQRVVVPIGNTEPFALGVLRWLSGTNAGLEHKIVAVEPGALVLIQQPPFEVGPGTRVLITEGCDGRLQTCSGRFHNVDNFRGEPHLPGTDILMRYPGD